MDISEHSKINKNALWGEKAHPKDDGQDFVLTNNCLCSDASTDEDIYP